MSQLLTDIYTKNPIKTQSEEHILQAALGGRLTSDSLIDKSTNDRFGHTIDAALELALRPFRLIMGVENAHGKPASAAVVQGEDDRSYRVRSGGIVEVVPSGKVERVSAREYRLDAEVGCEADLRHMLRKKAKESGHELNQLVEKAMALSKHRREPIPPLTFEIKGMGGEEFRAIAKSACNLLAHHERDLFLAPEFDTIRTFILREEGQDEWDDYAYPVFVEMGYGVGEVDHLVRVERQASGEVLGLVVLFGHLATLIRLGISSHAFPPRSYRVDPMGKEQRLDHQKDFEVPLPDWKPARSIQAYSETLVAQMERLRTAAEKIQRGLWIESTVTPFLHRWADEEHINGGPLDEARVREIVGEMTAALIYELEPAISAAAARRRAAAFPT